MENEADYEVIITHEGVLVFLIKHRLGEPVRPFILYDDSKHATLYRKENETILLDYLDDRVAKILATSSKAVVFELSDETEDIELDYEVCVKHIKKNTFAQNAGDCL